MRLSWKKPLSSQTRPSSGCAGCPGPWGWSPTRGDPPTPSPILKKMARSLTRARGSVLAKIHFLPWRRNQMVLYLETANPVICSRSITAIYPYRTWPLGGAAPFECFRPPPALSACRGSAGSDTSELTRWTRADPKTTTRGCAVVERREITEFRKSRHGGLGR